MLCLSAACSDNSSTPKELDERVSASDLAQTDDPQITNLYYFGFDLRASPQEDARQYLPFLKYLEEKTGYQFKIRFTPKDGKIADDLGKGVVQFAAIGATSYIQASDKYDVIPVVRGLNKQGKAEYRSFLVVRPNSGIAKYGDFYGKRFAFGSVSSTQGHLIPRILLAQNDIAIEDFDSYDYTGSHQNCAEAVIAGRADICGMQDTMAEELARQGKLKIIQRSEYFPSSGIAANNKVPMQVIKAVKQALIEFDPEGKDAEGLYHWDRTEMPKGFIEADDKDYNALRAWMQKLKISVLDTVAKFRDFLA